MRHVIIVCWSSKSDVWCFSVCVCENRSRFFFPSLNFRWKTYARLSIQVTRYFLTLEVGNISNVDSPYYSCKERWEPLNILPENQYHLAAEYVQKRVECDVSSHLRNGYFLGSRVSCAASHTRTLVEQNWGRSSVCSSRRVFTGDGEYLWDEEILLRPCTRTHPVI